MASLITDLLAQIPTQNLISTAQSLLEGNDVDHVCDMQETVIIAASLHTYSIEYGFGSHYRFLIAIGGLLDSENGILVAARTFITLFTTLDFSLITYDDHGDVY